MANIKDVAKLAGVSKSTVSRVVSDTGFVKEETRDKILQAMEQLNYRPNMFAKGMRTNRSYSIGILFPDLGNPFFTEWFQVVDSIAREKGYLNYICITDPKGESEEKRIDDLLSRSIDGIILFSYRKSQQFIEKLKRIDGQTPIVCCDSMFVDSGLSCVCANGEKGTYDATIRLLESGRKRIAYVKGKPEYAVVNKRYEGYLEAMKEHGSEINDAYVYDGEFSRECGVAAAQYLMSLESPPNAIMAATDNMALGVLDFLKGEGFKVPEQVAVVGYDDLAIAKEVLPRLSTIALPMQQIAERSIQLLMQQMEKENREPVVEVFDCTVKFRESTEV